MSSLVDRGLPTALGRGERLVLDPSTPNHRLGDMPPFDDCGRPEIGQRKGEGVVERLLELRRAGSNPGERRNPAPVDVRGDAS
jgi:hypothetical protein